MQKPAKENPTIRKVKVVECLTNARDSVPPVGGESTMIGRPKWFPKSQGHSREAGTVINDKRKGHSQAIAYVTPRNSHQHVHMV